MNLRLHLTKKQARLILWLIAGYAITTLLWGGIQRISDPVITVYVPLDGIIPFCEWFVIPYVLWYVCLAASAGYFIWKEPDTFIKMGTVMVVGTVLADILFLIVPNGIDFRPKIADLPDNLLADLVGLLYAADQPENACPSMHVFHCLAMWAGVHHATTVKKRWLVEGLTVVGVVLITLSTFYIKQHSVLDAVGALVLFLPVYWWAFLRKRNKKEAV